MRVEIDKYAGFCFGVTHAIREAEKFSKSGISCLGEIVHNSKEEQRLNKLGMKTISYDHLEDLSGKKMLIRAHGEPPETYSKARDAGIEIVDATCPVVLRLQKRIKEKFEQNPKSQIIIFGKKGHAEVNGLVGQTEDKAIVISSIQEADALDLQKSTFLFSQTTSDYFEYDRISDFLKEKSLKINGTDELFTVFQTICPSVKNRIPRLKEFCAAFDLIVFVSDNKSSNGKMLYEVCSASNSRCHFVTEPSDIQKDWFAGVASVGISGATSTPLWLMEDVKIEIINLLTN